MFILLKSFQALIQHDLLTYCFVTPTSIEEVSQGCSLISEIAVPSFVNWEEPITVAARMAGVYGDRSLSGKRRTHKAAAARDILTC